MLRKRSHKLLPGSSISTKITFAYIWLFALLIVLLAVTTYFISSKILINKTIVNMQQNLQLASEKLDMVLSQAETFAQMAITDEYVQDIMSSPRSEYLAHYNDQIAIQNALFGMTEKTMIDSVIVYDQIGGIYGSGVEKNITDTSRPYMHKFSSSKSTSQWMDTTLANYQREDGPRNVISLYQKFYSAGTGLPIGLIQLSINEKSISKQYGNISIGKGGSIFIMNRKGKIVSDDNKSRLYTSVENEPYFNWALNHQAGDIFKIDGEKQIVVSRFFPKLDWIILGVVPVGEVTKDNQMLIRQFTALSLLFIVLAAVLTYVTSKSITRPLLAMKKTVKKMKEGNMDVVFDIESRDEIGALGAEFNKMVNRTKHLMEQIVEDEKKRKEIELAALQSQINPHFLYNTLESISALADLGRGKDIVSLVKQLAAFYRGVLSKGSPIIRVEDELNITRNYLDILKVRYGDRISSRFDVEPGVLPYRSIKLLLQPLVENAVYHGLRYKRGKGIIGVRVYSENNLLMLKVTDNGIGMQPDKLNAILREHSVHGSGFGVKSTDERIKLHFGTSYGLRISSVYGEGTTVTAMLPLLRMEGETDDTDHDHR
ncbi:histidine kinase [Paenibacillus sp. J23TS9]|uniref:sensor histidine kinase n=1 Tax=Paenibacillus sp. J23TS9 TaxID=2807193 RepID=UPI001B26000C|nr:sensor histidine kinase [Paenibacillus sp. J23TS9]GIP29303.1 histidine kinase [Paenibacillus sp. J23TS9]